MSYQPLNIPGFDSGLVKNVDDSLIPNDACASLINAYVWRKRLLKKGGYFLFGRLGRRQDNLVGAGGVLNYTPVEPGSMSYVEGGNTHTDVPVSAVAGTIAGGTITYATGTYAGLPFPGVMSYNVVTDQFSPAMGLFEREIEGINDEECIAFDRRMAYVYDGTQFVHSRFYLGGINAVEWTGEDFDFFNATNYYGAFWATNHVPGLHAYVITNITVAAAAIITIGAHGFAVNDIVHISGVTGMVEINGLSGTVTGTAANTITVNINSLAFTPYASGGLAQALTHTVAARGDGIRWYAGSGWVNFAPPLSSAITTPYLQGSKFILPYKERLICFNTWEGTTYANRRNFHNRIRWSGALSTPYYANIYPTGYSYSPGTWYQEPGGGGYLEAPTEEEIIGVQYLKDYILVLFEESSYLLVYTGNRNLPFVFQKVNTDFGCESSNSVISFDDEILAVGNRGIYEVATSGAKRIDEKIPDLAFEMQNNVDGVKRVYGVRNFFKEVVFWSYRSIDTMIQGKFPNRVLVYNYINNTWAIFKNSFTCYGNHVTQNDVVWDDVFAIWDDYDVLWSDARNQSNNPTTIAGNQQGYIFGLDLVGETSINGNSISLTVSAITTGVVPSVFTCMNHNLEPGDFIYFTGVLGTAELLLLNLGVYQVTTISYTDDTFTLVDDGGNLISVNGTYYGNGKVIVLDNFEIVTKAFNPFIEDGKKSRFGMADFLINGDDDAEVLLESYVDKNPYTTSFPSNSETIQVLSGVPVKSWYRTYPQTIGQFIQFRLLFSETFMMTRFGGYPSARTGLDITLSQIWFTAAGRNIR